MKTIFFSLDKIGAKASNKDIVDVRARLKQAGIPSVIVIGCYMGATERSIKAIVTNELHAKLVEGIARMYDQESILTIDSEHNAMLTYLDNKQTVRLGTFREIKPQTAELLKSWTFDATVNKFYACL